MEMERISGYWLRTDDENIYVINFFKDEAAVNDFCCRIYDICYRKNKITYKREDDHVYLINVEEISFRIHSKYELNMNEVHAVVEDIANACIKDDGPRLELRPH